MADNELMQGYKGLAPLLNLGQLQGATLTPVLPAGSSEATVALRVSFFLSPAFLSFSLTGSEKMPPLNLLHAVLCLRVFARESNLRHQPTVILFFSKKLKQVLETGRSWFPAQSSCLLRGWSRALAAEQKKETPLDNYTATSPKPRLTVLICLCPVSCLEPVWFHALLLHFSLFGEYTTHLSQSQALPTHCHPSMYMDVDNIFVYNNRKLETVQMSINWWVGN